MRSQWCLSMASPGIAPDVERKLISPAKMRKKYKKKRKLFVNNKGVNCRSSERDDSKQSIFACNPSSAPLD